MMRRFVLVMVIGLVTSLALVPALGGASAASPNRVSLSSKPQPEQRCAKSKSSKGTKSKSKSKKAQKTKKTAKGKSKKGSKTHKSKSTPCAVKSPAKKGKAKKPTARPTATATFTDTATDTPTLTSTPSETPTPSPSIATFTVRGDVKLSYLAAFYVCGLPAGVTASFSPNPAVSQLDTTSPALGRASSTLTVSTPFGTPALAYSLALHAYYEDPSGKPTLSPPGGGMVEPRGLILNVDSSGSTSLTSLPIEPAVGFDSCSAIPTGFAPAPTATPSPSDLGLSAWVSDAHPVTGEREEVFGQILVRGTPAAVVLMHTHWFFPDAVRGCDGYSDSHGVASCALVIPSVPPNQNVKIQVSFEYNGAEYTTYTSFMT